jgi:serpin B
MRFVSALALLLLGLTACEKTKPVAETPPSVSSSLPSPAEPKDKKPVTTAAAASMPANARTLANGSNAFGFDLWKNVSKTKKENLAVSPASISLAFAMTYGGAKGETAAQMKKVLHFEEEPKELGASWGALGRTLEDPSRPIKLRIANRLFGEKTYTFVPEFLQQTKTSFNSGLEPVDFKNAAEPARVRINGWVEEKTEKRIKDLLPPQSLGGLTRMVLVNAIYFLGDWAEPFEVARTQDAPFYTSAGQSKPVPTMQQTSHFAAGQASGVKLVELPYKGDSASLLLVVPEKVDGLPAIEASLSTATLDQWKGALSKKNTAVWLPRFELNPAESLTLSSELKALGMPLPFERLKADFTAMGNPPDVRERLNIDEAFHKAFVKVDEKGTEAAAATAVVMMEGGGMPAKPFEVKADRPFLFFVLDRASGLVLFMGRVTKP